MSRLEACIKNEKETCLGDVVLVADFEDKFSKIKTKLALYKTLVHGPERGLNKTAWEWCYFILSKDDEFPIIVTEEYANRLVENPDEASSLVINTWMNRNK